MRFGTIVIMLFMVSAVFADVAPPPPPTVVVHLVSNGQPVTSIDQITYNCPEAYNETFENLSCSGGTCSNSPDQSERSYCNYFPDGYFTYMYGGMNKSSQIFNNTLQMQPNNEFTIDVATGKVTESPLAPQPPNQCLPSFVLVLLAVICLVRKV